MELPIKLIETEKKVRGDFNKDLLLNSFFEHTEHFSPAAKTKLETGQYCNEPYNSKKYNIFWGQEKERCQYGYKNPITGVDIPGMMYFFLNYKQLQIVEDPTKKVSKRITSFPRFWPIHYFFFREYLKAREHGFNMAVLKPRGTGWSELMSAIGTYYYTFQTEDPVFFFAATEAYLNKSGLITKAWDNINFLYAETQRAFKHLRQEKDQDLHKRASYWNAKGVEVKTGGEIIGRVIDNPNKVRGARGHVFFEEGGSFARLVEAWMTCWALVTQGGVSFANMMAWGTGGEQGPGIQGLEDIFTNPEPYNCLPFDNCWEESPSLRDHGFFFPTWALMDRFMDKWGNTDYNKAIEYHNRERELKLKKSPHLYDKFIAEYPFTPSEALMRLQGNDFPVAHLQKQLRRIDNSQDIQGILKRGTLDIDDGKVKFILKPNIKPIDRYPHNTEEGVEGCVTIYESPLKDQLDQVPANLYTIVADCFYMDTDQATDWESLGTFYVYKRKNTLFPTEDDILVAWYAGRPKKANDFYRLIFLAARYYNAMVQTEIKGGGQNLLDYARNHNLVQYCGERQTIFTTDREISRSSSRQYFIRMEKDDKANYLTSLKDWLLTERALTINSNNETQYVLNLETIYDRALLEELIKFQPEGNFDRISALLVLMATKQEHELRQIEEQSRYNEGHIFRRGIFSDNTPKKGILTAAEILRGIRATNDPTDLVI